MYSVQRQGLKKKLKEADLEVTNDADIIGVIERELEKNKDRKAPVIKEEQYVLAHIEGKMKNFLDGNMVTIVLDEDLITSRYGLSFKGYSFGVQGWIIDDRVFFKLGYDHDVTLLDLTKQKGVLLTDLLSKKRIDVLLKNIIYQK